MLRVWQAVAAVTLLGAVLRLHGIGEQSYWYDEIATLGVIEPASVVDVLARVRDTQATPPLYYVAAWAWSQPFGTGEGALRALSALAGTAAVLFTHLAGAALHSRRAGIAAALLVAVNPMLVWYGQEARAYGLVIALAALSLWLTARVLQRPSAGRLAALAAAGVALLLTHYFGVFLLLGELAALLWRLPARRRALVVAAVPAGLVGAALIPLARIQQADGRVEWIGGSPLGERAAEVGRELATWDAGLISASSPAPGGPWGVLALAGVVTAAALAALAIRRRAPGAAVAVAITGIALGVPLLLALGSLDFFKDRNLMAAWLPLAVALGAGLAAARTRRARAAAAAAAGLVAVAGIAVTLQVAARPELQRTDWRGIAARLGPPREGRVIEVRPAYEWVMLAHYGHRLGPVMPGVAVRESVVIGREAGDVARTTRSNPGARVVARARPGEVPFVRARLARPVTFTHEQVEALGPDVLYEPGPAASAWLDAFAAQATALRAAPADAAERVARIPPPPAELPVARGWLRSLRAAGRDPEAIRRALSALPAG